MERVVYDGVCLTDRYDVVSLRRPPSPQVSTETIGGRDGVVVTDSSLKPPEISMTIVSRGGSVKRFRHEIAAIFAEKGPKALQFSGDDGLYYVVHPSSIEWSGHATFGSARIEFTVPDVFMYGAKRSAVVDSGTVSSFSVGGNVPTRPTIEGSVRRSASTGRVGIVLDDAEFVHLRIDTPNQVEAYVDCDRRYASVNDITKLPTLDSDWLSLDAGMHTMRMDEGTGTVTVSWTERWV